MKDPVVHTVEDSGSGCSVVRRQAASRASILEKSDVLAARNVKRSGDAMTGRREAIGRLQVLRAGRFEDGGPRQRSCRLWYAADGPPSIAQQIVTSGTGAEGAGTGPAISARKRHGSPARLQHRGARDDVEPSGEMSSIMAALRSDDAAVRPRVHLG